MSDKLDWPQLAPSHPATVDSLQEQIIQIAERVRRFEAALEETGEAGEADLAIVEKQLATWELRATNIFRFTGLGSGQPLAKEDVEAVAKGLPEVYDHLRELRLAMLDKLGAVVAARVRAREPEVKIDMAQLRKPPIVAGEFDEQHEEPLTTPRTWLE